MGRLNFSWVIDGMLAGHQAPSIDEDLAFLKEQGVQALVRMAEGENAIKMSKKVQTLGLTDLHIPVQDFTAPTQDQIVGMVDFISKSIAEQKPVGVSCGAGYGRTGTILACYLVMQCSSAEQAIQEVHTKRPGSIETPEQEGAIRNYAQRLGKQE